MMNCTIKDSFGFQPPVTFYFRAKLLPNNKIKGALTQDTSFMEVSGISSKMETEVLTEGGNLRSVYNLPKGIKYDNLLLKRVLSPANSNFSIWCKLNLNDEGFNKIVPGNVQISLLQDDTHSLCNWTFYNAYPIKWSMDQLNSKKNELAIETIEICYEYFRRNL